MPRISRLRFVVCAIAVLELFVASACATETFDVVVYDGSSAGVTAAVEAARLGKSVALIEPTQRLGGLTTNGLGATDFGIKTSVQGMAKEFYNRVGDKYGSVAALWRFEPKVAEQVMEEMVAAQGIAIFRGERLDRGTGGITKDGTRIVSIRMESGLQFAASVFIDASYEGDLMAAAGVSYIVGREANSVYGESGNGVQPNLKISYIDPYVVPGDPSSGVLPLIEAEQPGPTGSGDDRTQAYNYRLCLTTEAANKRPWTAPADYDPARYEAFRRHIASIGATAVRDVVLNFADLEVGSKFDMNNEGGAIFSSDYIGANFDYPDGDYATREAIVADHRSFQQGLCYFLATDPAVPQSMRDEMNSYGLAYDEFPENDGWSGELYVREARRMLGEYVVTEHDAVGDTLPADSIGLASYDLDSHNTRRYVNASGNVQIEGGFLVDVPQPFPVSYRALTPVESEATNLLVVCAISASHVVYASVRMEPVYMIMGQAAGAAASMAIDDGVHVQDVAYQPLGEHLVANGGLLAWPRNDLSYTGTVAVDFNEFGALPHDLKWTELGSGLVTYWGGSESLDIIEGELTTDVGGYAIAQTTGGVPGLIRGAYGGYRQSYRTFLGQYGGTVWFSMLVEQPHENSVAGLSFNCASDSDYSNSIRLRSDDILVMCNGVLDAQTEVAAIGETHLLVGRIDVGPGPDRVAVWLDPESLERLGVPNVVNEGVDFADYLHTLGVVSYNNGSTALGGYLDAVRMSNRTGALGFEDVTGVVPNDAGLDGDGDLDCSGAIDEGDIAPFVQALIDPAAYEAAHPSCDIELADLNDDGFRDGNDVQAFVEALIGS